MAFTLSEAQPAEAVAVTEFLLALGQKATERHVREAISDSRRAVVLARVGERLIGWGKTHIYDSADGQAPAGHYLGGVVVAPEWRRLGVGQALVQRRLDWIAGSHVPGISSAKAYFVTNAANEASIRLHAPFGFMALARGTSFHGVTFSSAQGPGRGILFSVSLVSHP